MESKMISLFLFMFLLFPLPSSPFLCAIFSIYTTLFCVSPLHVSSRALAAPMTAQVELNREEEQIKKWDTLSSLFYSLDNQLLEESKGRLKGARVEAESADASAPRGYLGPFDSIQSSLHLPTCPQDEKLSSVSAGHKSHSGSGVQIRGELCVCWVFILLCIMQCFYHHKSLSLDLWSHTLVRTILKQDFLNYLSRRDCRRDLKGF